MNGALSAVHLVLVCIGRNHGHPHKHEHTQGAEVSDLSLHTVASKTRDEEQAEGLRASCVTKTWSPCAMTTCTSSSGSEQLLFNGQSRTDHEAEMVLRQQLSYSHSPSDTRISGNSMCLKSQTWVCICKDCSAWLQYAHCLFFLTKQWQVAWNTNSSPATSAA